MSMVALFDKLREHELELERLNEEENQGRKMNIAFKFEVLKSKSFKEDDDSDFENIDLIMKKFINFMKNKNTRHHKREGKKGKLLFKKKKWEENYSRSSSSFSDSNEEANICLIEKIVDSTHCHL